MKEPGNLGSQKMNAPCLVAGSTWSSACTWGHCHGQQWAGPAGNSIAGAWGCPELCLEEFVAGGVTQTLVPTQGSWILLYSPLIPKHTFWTASLNTQHQSAPLQALHIPWNCHGPKEKQTREDTEDTPGILHVWLIFGLQQGNSSEISEITVISGYSANNVPKDSKQLSAGLASLGAGLSEEGPHHVTQIFFLSSSHFAPVELSPPGTHGEDEQTSFVLGGMAFGIFFEPSMRNRSCGCLTHLLPCCYIYQWFLSPGSVWDPSHLSKRRGIQHCHMTEVEGEGGRGPGDAAYITFTSGHMSLRLGKQF